jgi:hypothetical protein
MLPEDEQMFLDFVRGRDPVVTIHRSAESSTVAPVSIGTAGSDALVLWNKKLLSHLERELVQRSPGSNYYRIDGSLPVLEFSRSRRVDWNRNPALLQGRVYGLFSKPDVEYENWYKSIARWIRRHFVKGPLKILDGYVGPEAFKWFQDGGTLLPMFEPPTTSEWLSFVDGQHTVASSNQI